MASSSSGIDRQREKVDLDEEEFDQNVDEVFSSLSISSFSKKTPKICEISQISLLIASVFKWKDSNLSLEMFLSAKHYLAISHCSSSASMISLLLLHGKGNLYQFVSPISWNWKFGWEKLVNLCLFTRLISDIEAVCRQWLADGPLNLKVRHINFTFILFMNSTDLSFWFIWINIFCNAVLCILRTFACMNFSFMVVVWGH